MASKPTSVVIAAEDLAAGYGRVPVVRNVDLQVPAGEVAVLVGANGAGKTTTLMALVGRLRPSAGTVSWLGEPVRSPLNQRARAGLRYVPEERGVIRRLSVRDNIRLGFGDIDSTVALFPKLKALLKTPAGQLSGGEQQMLSIGLALGGSPRALIVDELSFGLAPVIVDHLLEVVRQAADDGVAVLLVEQHVERALEIADRGYVMHRGRIALQGTGAELIGRMTEIQATYLSGPRAG